MLWVSCASLILGESALRLKTLDNQALEAEFIQLMRFLHFIFIKVHLRIAKCALGIDLPGEI